MVDAQGAHLPVAVRALEDEVLGGLADGVVVGLERGQDGLALGGRDQVLERRQSVQRRSRGPAAWRTAGPGLAACATAQPIAGRTAPVSAS